MIETGLTFYLFMKFSVQVINILTMKMFFHGIYKNLKYIYAVIHMEIRIYPARTEKKVFDRAHISFV